MALMQRLIELHLHKRRAKSNKIGVFQQDVNDALPCYDQGPDKKKVPEFHSSPMQRLSGSY